MAKKEFVLRHEYKNVKDLIEGKYYRSEWEENYDVRWRVSTCKTEEHLDLYLEIDIENGSVLAEFKLSIIKANGEVLSKRPGKNLFEPGMKSSWGYKHFTDWKNVIDNYLIDGNLKVEAHVTILEIKRFKDSVSEKEFVLRHEFQNVKDFKKGNFYYSEREENYDVRWRLCTVQNEERLGLYLGADLEEGSKQSVLVKFKSCVIKTNGEVISTGPNEILFEPGDANTWGRGALTGWKNVMDNCLINGNLKVEAHVTILEMKGFTREKLRSFGEDAKKYSDMTLIVGQEKFYISKLFLSAHSSYFDTLFLGPFQESGKTEVQLKDVNPNDLQYFLEVLYGDPSIDDLTVRKILSLADMYDTQIVIKKCGEFLLEKSKKSLQEKLQLAGKYKLEDLKESCIENINSVADFREAIPSNLREIVSDSLADLLENILALY